ncbi:MAG: NADH oxidoreductase (quinone) subunit F [Deltaproteobacteria bacterium CG2_30_63_29]|nr:MAG: NADH oxidoreductase (quinone) subunit F [Deltaproteobacteria bacterium CG2_30_63_29]PIV99551.1 MAG: NADH-quinone oxidoreductase subunit F [Deltaproteobacteria bacterium CG17_big_fil_post_rev_8_21_14_2_50_63_7]PJB41098.1 MAG: NADH-quinone oxidoreductase subunit F [Deltaproteobacteria bacterium CG_4_9_14_3_um_filter_63_12]
MRKLFTKCLDFEKPWDIDVYISKQGGYRSPKKSLSMEPSAIIDEVKKSNLRGRGGAGFPTGLKWSFLPKDSEAPKYLVINADEGEPGTFKDRLILEFDPHRLLEGCITACYTLGAHVCYIYIRGELRQCHARVEEAIAQARSRGFLGEGIFGTKYDLEIYVHTGAGAYICGEETALLESLEGKAGKPRMKPPFPAVVGLFGCPTIINNVETIACIPTIINDGGEAFAADGCERNGGIKLYGISGHSARPGMYEAPQGISMRELIYGDDFGRGIREGRELKGVIPGGSSCPCILPADIDVAMDFDSLRKVNSLFGTGGLILMDDQTCMVRVAATLATFYHIESCGQCTPCREGTGWLKRVLDNIEAGTGTPKDLALLKDVCDNIAGNTICPHGDAASMAVGSYLRHFMPEFEAHVERGGCWFPEW